jgi:K+-sensing histidine kinase KdpD
MQTIEGHEVQSLMSQAIGPACHEMRSPLAVVFGFAKLLENNASLDPKAKEFAAQIVNGSQRLDDLLDLLARLGRIAAGRIEPSIGNFELGSVVAEVAAVERDGRSVTVDDDCTPVTVKADPSWLREALGHVVDGLAFEEGIDVRLMWTVEDGSATVVAIPSSGYGVIGADPSKAGLGISLARVQVVAMGGSFAAADDRVALTVPRH